MCKYIFIVVVWTFAITSLQAEKFSSIAPFDTLPAPADLPPSTPLMNILENAGVSGFFKDSGISIFGYAEAGYMHDATAQGKHDGPTFIGFNSFKDELIFDKISLNVERTVDPSAKKLDMGFRLEGIYGADAAFIHANGLGDLQHGREQTDLLQAYLDFSLPGLPVKIRLGKWLGLAGFEHFSANIYGAFGSPARGHYSYSYQFLFAEAGTQTGALATWVINPQWTIDAGMTRGWNQSTRDANNMLDFLSRIVFTPTESTTVSLVITAGPEFPSGFGPDLPSGDNTNSWTALDLLLTQKVSDDLLLGLCLDYVTAPQIPASSIGSPKWGGAAGYLSYTINKNVTLNSRLEAYSDAAGGFSAGAPQSANFYEATLSFAVKPLPGGYTLSHLLLRPEIRYDLSDQPLYGAGDKNQLTFSIDALFTF